MRGLVFAILTLILGGVIGLGLEYCANFLPNQIHFALTRVYTFGIHPISAGVTICGVLGLVFGYLIIEKFVKK
ncbi:MAG: hypothetical protein IJ876_04760 [Elusimicrobiaceae bacterium]|nr:hypothetical protein [Elusimicrobiaceae bacterium]